MYITITELAAEKINKLTTGKNGYIKLIYDIDGCGCGVNGVAALLFVGELEENDQEINTNEDNIYIEKSQEVFFDEKMTIDFSEKANSFQLKSPNEYLNPRMSFYDRTKQEKENK